MDGVKKQTFDGALRQRQIHLPEVKCPNVPEAQCCCLAVPMQWPGNILCGAKAHSEGPSSQNHAPIQMNDPEEHALCN